MNWRRFLSYVLILLLVLLFMIILVLGVFGKKVSNTFNSISNSLPDSVPEETPSLQPETQSLQQQLQAIDQSLSQSMQSSIAYNAPSTMKLDETVTIELLINPSKSPAQLESQITESGSVVTAMIEITPLMRAELIAQDKEAFLIQPIHSDSEQLIGSTETTRWAWQITAKKSGDQKLTLVIYRLVKFEGKDYWREVQSYKADIVVKVSFGQRLGMIDWKWIVGIIITAILVPAFWRWIDSRKKQNDTVDSSKGKAKSGRKTGRKKT